VSITAGELQELERIRFDGQQRSTKQDFAREYIEEPLGGFIRSIVGLDIKTAQAAFAEFLQVSTSKLTR
jgi:type I restriction enzyme, R subunit